MEKEYCITSSEAFCPHRVKNPKIIIKGEVISQIGADIEIPPNIKVFDFKDKIILPGFIDIHIHGAVGYDFYSDEEKIQKICAFLAKCGTTSCVATLYPVEFEKIKNAISSIVKIIKKGTSGAKIIGINLEGPYLSKENPGVLNTGFFKEINLSEIKEIIEISEGYLKIVTISPEIKNSDKAIKILVKNGIVVSLGHSRASYLHAKKAIDAGANLSCHTFNAMGQLHHREPSLVGAVLLSDNVFCEVICDGEHLHPDIIKLLYKIKGREKVILISDAIPALGKKDGEYRFLGQKVFLKNKKVINEDGKLAGSVLTLSDAFSNIIKFAGISVEDAVCVSSLNQARLLKMDNLGRLKAGSIADMVIVDKNLNVCNVVINGKLERKV